jgi:Transposase DDE domain group 1
MRRSPRNLKIACNHKGLTHYGGAYFFHEFIQVLQLRHWLCRKLNYPRRNQRYTLSQITLALVYPIVLGLDRIETASFLRTNGTFQYLTGLPSYPDPQTLRRFLSQAPPDFREQLHRVNNWLQQRFIHWPEHRSRLILDLDSTVVTVFGSQEGAEVGYNPRYRGKRSYDPLLCLEAHSSLLWDAELRPGNAGTWAGSIELLASCFLSIPSDIRELRVRADAGFGYNPVFEVLEARRGAQYAVVARMTASLKRKLHSLHYQRLNSRWEIGEFGHRPADWPHARRCIVARRPIQESEPEPTLFTLKRYLYRAWITNLSLTPAGVWNFYDGRAGMEPRIRELRDDFALRNIPTGDFAANALYLEVIRLAYNLVTAFQRTCLPQEWQKLTLSKLRYKLFWLPGELTRPQNRPTLRLANSPAIKGWTEKILHRVHKIKPLDG